jgi:penicillin-binding protein 1C
VPFGCNIASESKNVALWPSRLQSWLPAEFRTTNKIPAIDHRCPNQLMDVNRLPMTLSGIEDGDALMVPPNKPKSVTVFVQGGQAPYYWFLNGLIVDNSTNNFTFAAAAQNQYELIVTDRNGLTIKRTLNVFSQQTQ